MIEDRKLTRTVMLRCNNGNYKTVEQVAEVQIRWTSDTPEVDPNPLGFVNATPWQLVANDDRNIEYERRALFAASPDVWHLVAEFWPRVREAYLSPLSNGDDVITSWQVEVLLTGGKSLTWIDRHASVAIGMAYEELSAPPVSEAGQ